MSCLPIPASATARRAASLANASGLLPGTLPTSDIPIPITATLPRRVLFTGIGFLFSSASPSLEFRLALLEESSDAFAVIEAADRDGLLGGLCLEVDVEIGLVHEPEQLLRRAQRTRRRRCV